MARKRDKWYHIEKKEKEEEAIRLEKASSNENYTKKNRKPKNLDKTAACYTYEYWNVDDEDDHGCFVKINETINMKANESSVFVSADVFDRGELEC
jgi:hypothetical protein